MAGIALLLAGCATRGSAGDPGGSTSATRGGATDRTGGPAGQVSGRTFLSTSVDGHSLVAGSAIRIEFTRDGEIRVGAGCNSMSGRATWIGDRVSVADLAMTAMGCAQALMDQDAWLSGLLTSGLVATVNDEVLTLSGQGVTLRLADRRVADPDRPLQGTLWRLDGILTGSGPTASMSSVPRGIVATLRIADGRIHFFDGLNDSDGPVNPGGTIVVGPDTVQIHGEIATSAVGCAGTCSVDMSLLTHDFAYRITAGRLTVTGTGPEAGKGLVFVADKAAGTSTAAAPSHIGPVPPTRSAPAESVPAGAPPAESVPVESMPVGSVPVEPAPVVPPGSVSRLTSGATARPTPSGRHDSIPPQPSPDSAPPTGDTH